MKSLSRTASSAPMSADAYAGFLKLWLTPPSKLPAISSDVEAYLRHASEREPLSPTAQRAMGLATDLAA
jgi:hypothetical protein